jgi:hypothetical protein
MGNLTDFLTSNLINAAGLDPNVKIEAAIVSVRPREFEDGTTKPVIYTDHLGQGLVLNQTRLKAGIAAWGPNPDNWIGKIIIISQGMTTYAGKETPCVVMEPVVANRLKAGAPRVAITSGRAASIKAVENAPPRDCYDGPSDGGGDTTEDIPF